MPLLLAGLIAALSPGYSPAMAAGAKNANQPIVVAQAKPQLRVSRKITARPGETVDVPVQARSDKPIAPTSHVIIDGAPAWLKLSKGEEVGDGVWLLRASELADLRARFPANAKGAHEISVLLVNKDGKIDSEAILSVEVLTPGGVAKGPTTWQSLLKEDGTGQAPNAPAVEKRTTSPKIVKKAKVVAPKPKKTVRKKMDAGQRTAYAKHLVRECTTCHSLFGQDVGIPVMVGLTIERFTDTMQLYRDGKRDNLAMINVSRSLDDQQIQTLAEYLGGVRAAPKIVQARQSILGGNAGQVRKAPASRRTVRASKSSLVLAKRKITPVKLKRADRWVVKGEELLRAGRVAQARLWFRRAAEYGVAKAAMLLGASFDPNFLTSRTGGGLKPNPGKAKDWYLYARQLGSQIAAQRLSNLPTG